MDWKATVDCGVVNSGGLILRVQGTGSRLHKHNLGTMYKKSYNEATEVAQKFNLYFYFRTFWKTT